MYLCGCLLFFYKKVRVEKKKKKVRVDFLNYNVNRGTVALWQVCRWYSWMKFRKHLLRFVTQSHRFEKFCSTWLGEIQCSNYPVRSDEQNSARKIWLSQWDLWRHEPDKDTRTGQVWGGGGELLFILK